MTDSIDNARGPERIWHAIDRRGKIEACPDAHVQPCDDVASAYVEYIRADLVPDPLGAVKVKPLEWEEFRWGDVYTVCGLYKAKIDDGGGVYSLTWGGKVIRDSDGRIVWFETLEAAKAAAQADYEARIRSALEPCDPLADPRVARMIDALRYYADPKTYEPDKRYANEPWPIFDDEGALARAALAAFDKGEPK